jgi:hypothetical protein
MPHLGGMIKPATVVSARADKPPVPPGATFGRPSNNFPISEGDSPQVVLRPLFERGERFEDLHPDGVGSGAVLGRVPANLTHVRSSKDLLGAGP